MTEHHLWDVRAVLALFDGKRPPVVLDGKRGLIDSDLDERHALVANTMVAGVDQNLVEYLVENPVDSDGFECDAIILDNVHLAVNCRVGADIHVRALEHVINLVEFDDFHFENKQFVMAVIDIPGVDLDEESGSDCDEILDDGVDEDAGDEDAGDAVDEDAVDEENAISDYGDDDYGVDDTYTYRAATKSTTLKAEAHFEDVFFESDGEYPDHFTR